MEQGGDKADSGRSDRAAAPLASPQHSPTLREPFRTFDDFLDSDDAAVLRSHYEAHFAEPHQHKPETHQLWNYWHVPDLYTYLRTSPEKVIPRPLVERFHARLSGWALETLGLGFVTWPNLSLYVHGCCQQLHNDATNGRFGFVYSLTPDSRRSSGGETIVLREGDLFRAHLARDAAGPALHELIAPRFNRLTIFDDRMPHGVRHIEGSMDPLDGRVVLHGHISEGHPQVRGPLSAGAVAAVIADAVEAGLLAAGAGADEVHGPLTIRLSVAAEGAVAEAHSLVDRVVNPAGADARPAVESILAHIRQLRFAPQEKPSEAWIPVMLGGTLRRVEEHLRRTAPAPTPAPAQAAPFKPAPVVALVPGGGVAHQPAAAAVSARLGRTSGVVRLPQTRLEAFVVPEFLTIEECERLKGEGTGDPELLARIEGRMALLTGLDPACGEPLEIEAIGGEGAEAAFDFLDPASPEWPEQARRGGQRSWTIMGFLDAPEEGGQLVFPNLRFKATPARGYLLVWNNLGADGAPNGFALHETLPVTRGVHRRFVKRYRERPVAAP